MTLSLEQVRRKLCERSGYQLEIIVNENRSSMLTVLDKRGKWVKLSLHRMFLAAPEGVINAVAEYLREKNESASKIIRSFIQANLRRIDYSHRLDPRTLYSQGHLYHLQEIFDEVNEEYFTGSVKLWITWFDRLPKKNSSRIVYGQYFEALKLIKVNKMLDNEAFPRFFVSFVVYHEMLHHVIPSYVDKRGVQCIHSKEFKEREQLFKEYKKAKAWELEYRHQFFAELN